LLEAEAEVLILVPAEVLVVLERIFLDILWQGLLSRFLLDLIQLLLVPVEVQLLQEIHRFLVL
jgi:hypothetical protein